MQHLINSPQHSPTSCATTCTRWRLREKECVWDGGGGGGGHGKEGTPHHITSPHHTKPHITHWHQSTASDYARAHMTPTPDNKLRQPYRMTTQDDHIRQPQETAHQTATPGQPHQKLTHTHILHQDYTERIHQTPTRNHTRQP